LALYLGVRPNELRALRWGDVDLVAKVVRVSRAHDAEAGEEKAPKSRAGLRSVPIPEPLLGLLSGQHEPSSPVVRSAPWEDLARLFRADLRAAGVTRERLFADTPTEEPVDFRSLRDTSATWSALAGVDLATLRRRLGHEDVATTDRYVRIAGDVHDPSAIGEPFPDLGLGPKSGHKPGPRRSKPSRLFGNSVAPVGLEPSPGGTNPEKSADSCHSSGKRTSPSDAQVCETTSTGPILDPVSALVVALERASAAGEWETVRAIAEALGRLGQGKAPA
jgi:hypothetical protein